MDQSAEEGAQARLDSAAEQIAWRLLLTADTHDHPTVAVARCRQLSRGLPVELRLSFDDDGAARVECIDGPQPELCACVADELRHLEPHPELAGGATVTTFRWPDWHLGHEARWQLVRLGSWLDDNL